MKHRKLLLAGLLTATLPLAACSQTTEALGEASGDAARVEPVKGGQVNRVILTQPAYVRLGIHTETVHGAAGNTASTDIVVPAAAVLYDAEGRTWIYTSEGPRTYVRHPVTVDHFDGDLAYLEGGPATGSTLVTIGVPELFGIEQGVDGE